MTYLEYLRSKVGSNWVVFARRTPRLVERYGEDVVVLTQKRYREIENEWRATLPRCPHCNQIMPDADQ
jgi:hypothetical protein